MELLFELLFETVGQLVLELLSESGFRSVARVFANRVVRVVLGISLAVGAGFGGGYWWGAHLTELGRTQPPRSLWVSIALAVVFAGCALAGLANRERPATDRWRLSPAQWRWTRFAGFALLNASVALGMAAGFSPRPLA